MKQQPIPEQVDLQSLIDAPLADPLKTYAPFGTRTIKRGPRLKYHDGIDAPKLTDEQLKKRKGKEESAKLSAVLDYYAGTTIPIERIAEHTGLSIEKATEAMKWRGRVI